MPTPTAPDSFQTTRWSLVRRAIQGDDPDAMRALTELCEMYWYPIYAYMRRSGCTAHDAEDHTQGFFASLLERGTLAKADAGKGKLRTFLLTNAFGFLRDARRNGDARKRGGGMLTSFDAIAAEKRYAIEPLDEFSPDRLFQRRWALTILERSLNLLAEESADDKNNSTFAALRPFLGFGAEPEKRYEEIAADLHMPLGTVKNHIFRLRKRWREIIFAQVSMTLDEATPEEIRRELAELLECV